MRKQNTNILVQYDGGGYDGCVWEWNFFYIDQDGKFEDIFSSGSGGIKTQKDADYLLMHGKNNFSNRLYIYNLNNHQQLKEFGSETNPMLVKGIVKWFNNYNVPDVQPFAICGECGAELEDADEICCEDWHGCGGIMSQPEILICMECRSLSSCSYCGEYYGSDSNELIVKAEQLETDWELPKGVAQQIIDNYSPICQCCAKTLLKREIDRLIQKTKT